MDCSICCEKFSKTTRKEIKCSFCEESACMVCYKKVILSSTEEARCIHCKKSFHLKFLMENFPTTFIWSNKSDSYRVHRESMLLDQQIVLLPETQKILSRRIDEEKLNSLNKSLNFYGKHISSFKDFKKKTNEKEAIEAFDNIINFMEKDFSKKNIEFIKLSKILKNKNDKNDKKEEKEEEKDYKTRGSCPVENCRGFIEDKWMCGMCKTKICSECMEIKNDSENKHECDKTILENVKEIRNSTKPCPKCRSRVFKIDGCYQMYCTKPNCNTFFDWKTGLELKKTAFVHNPHYTDYLNRNRNNIQCNDRIYFDEYSNSIGTSVENVHNLNIFSNLVNEIRDIYVERENIVQNYNNGLLEFRIKYLKNEINRKEFGESIQRLHKKFTKDSEVREIRLMFCEVSMDLLRILKKDKNYEKFCENIKTHVEYTNSVLEEIGKLYKNETPKIHPSIPDNILTRIPTQEKEKEKA
jgi:peroxiredoxin family protein